MEEHLRSQLRLFLSIDLSGSTRLKGDRNYSKIDPGDPRSLENLAQEDFDWAQIQMHLFHDFHADFISRVDTKDGVTRPFERSPWKALGDELVYSFEIKSNEQLVNICSAFLSTLRVHDAKSSTLRLTGTAWVAGFPLRNRVIEMPMSGGGSESSPYPARDFWGPDLDIGFRLGRHSYAGMCVASMSLVELCAQHDTREPVRFRLVGWENLKGVFDGKPYPIFWMDLPGNEATVEPLVMPWAQGESSLMKEWCQLDCGKDAHEFRELCEKIRSCLPEKFLLARPYIPNVTGVPRKDKELIETIMRLPKGLSGSQTVEPADVDPDEQKKVDDLRSRVGLVDREDSGKD